MCIDHAICVGMKKIQLAIKNGANVIGHVQPVCYFASRGEFSLWLQTSTIPCCTFVQLQQLIKWQIFNLAVYLQFAKSPK